MKNVLLIYIGFHCFLHITIYSQSYSVNDSLALLAIDSACDASDSLNWDREPDPQNWTGVTWDSIIPRRVIELNIRAKSLIGTMDLTSLESLSFLNCSFNQIDDLNITNLTSLIDLICSHNDLTNLDVSSLANLIYLDCYFNEISDLDVSGLTNLVYLLCEYNELNSLVLSDCPNLEVLVCTYNNLSSFDFSGLSKLTTLNCSGNSFDSLVFPIMEKLKSLSCAMDSLYFLDISNLSSLESLECSDNNLSELNLENQVNLGELNCWGNQLKELDLSATSLWWLCCSYNQLTELDISGQPYLVMLDCMFNQLVHLELADYYYLGFQYFDCSDNQLSDIDLSGASEGEIFLGCVVKNNKLPFSSLATGLAADIYIYSPQKTLYEPRTIEGNTTIDYSLEAMINGTATKFIFFKNGEEAEANSTGLYTTSDPGVYHCIMTNALFPDLTLTTAPITIIEGSGFELKTNAELLVYPNPVTDRLHIRLPQRGNNLQACIYTMDGRELLFMENVPIESEIDMSGFIPGVYVLKVTSQNSQAILRIVKH